MNSRRGVVLVGHDASRTGAPVAALSWLRWLADTRPGPVQVWLERSGPLADDFRALAPTRVLDGWRHEPSRRLPSAAGRGWIGPAVAGARFLGRSRHELASPPVVVANTVAAWSRAAAVRPRARLTLWVHELDLTVDRIISPGQRTELLTQTDHVVAVGRRVGEMVLDRWKVDPATVTVIDSFVDALAVAAPPPAAEIDVLGAGTLTPRKGPDQFVAVMAILHELRPGLKAAWVGGDLDAPTAAMVRHDLLDAGLADQVQLPGEVGDLGPWWPRSGILVHTAREDPAPLVVLEAAQRGVPVVTWDTGGAADLVRSAGLHDLVAPAGDLLHVARAAEALLADPQRRTDAGRALQHAAVGRTTAAVAPRLYDAVMGATS